MSILIKGDNNGIAVDGDLTIEHLDFSFGKGVTGASGIKRTGEASDENIIDAEVVEEADAQTCDFDADAVLEYVCQIKEDGEDNNALLVKFWKRLMERSGEMKVMRYNVMECVFVPGRNEKNVEFSKKFVCCMIGYLKNQGVYTLSHIDMSVMLGEGNEPDNARIKNMQQCLRDYDNSVKKVVDEVIREIFV